MSRRPPRSTRTDTLFPYTTLFRSPDSGCESIPTLPRRSGPAAIMFAGSPKMTNPKASAKHHRLAAVDQHPLFGDPAHRAREHLRFGIAADADQFLDAVAVIDALDQIGRAHV